MIRSRYLTTCLKAILDNAELSIHRASPTLRCLLWESTLHRPSVLCPTVRFFAASSVSTQKNRVLPADVFNEYEDDPDDFEFKVYEKKTDGLSTPELDAFLRDWRSAANDHDKRLTEERSEHSADGVAFEDFDLHPELLKRLKELDYQSPFEIQARTLKALLEGKNVIGQAVTGSGKTLAFALPIVNVLKGERKGSPRFVKGNDRVPLIGALVLTPTRELCNQIASEISRLDPKLRCINLYGGIPINRDLEALRRGADIVCATPGRLRDHITRQTLSVANLNMLVLDEADEMLKEDWMEDLENILKDSPKEKQVMLFSATVPKEFYDMANEFLARDIEKIRITAEDAEDNAPSAVKHLSLYAPPVRQIQTIKHIMQTYNSESTIIFVDTKRATSYFSTRLSQLGIRGVQTLQGDMTQRQRDFVIDGFRKGKIPTIVATDVAARGLNIPQVELIVQIGLPKGVSTYLHRSGRTGRAGKAGLAVLVHSSSRQEQEFIESLRKKVKGLVELDAAPRGPENEDPKTDHRGVRFGDGLQRNRERKTTRSRRYFDDDFDQEFYESRASGSRVSNRSSGSSRASGFTRERRNFENTSKPTWFDDQMEDDFKAFLAQKKKSPFGR